MSDEQFIKQFQDNYNRVFNYSGGQDIQLMMSLACKYTLAEKQFSGVALQKVMELVQEGDLNALPIRLETRTGYKLAYHLLQQDNMSQEIQRVAENDKILQEVKFKKSPLRTLGAIYLQQSNLEHALRAKKLFDEMHRNQPILTTKEDIPYIVFLTTDPDIETKDQADTIMKYYSSLKNNHFMMGNHLQALAQIMTVYSSNYNKTLMEYVAKLREGLLERGVKVKKLHYPYLGVLALAATNETKMNEITSLYNRLIELGIFKNAKDHALIVAIQKVVQDVLEVSNLIDITPLTNVVGLFDMVDFVLDLGPIFPSSVSDVIDFFN